MWGGLCFHFLGSSYGWFVPHGLIPLKCAPQLYGYTISFTSLHSCWGHHFILWLFVMGSLLRYSCKNWTLLARFMSVRNLQGYFPHVWMVSHSSLMLTFLFDCVLKPWSLSTIFTYPCSSTFSNMPSVSSAHLTYRFSFSSSARHTLLSHHCLSLQSGLYLYTLIDHLFHSPNIQFHNSLHRNG